MKWITKITPYIAFARVLMAFVVIKNMYVRYIDIK